MTPDEGDALEAFERLGLTNYEAKVFIALQRLGSGTARDVSDVVDVPRSQVYSVAEDLEERGLLEVQQSSPIRYRPVDVDEARSILENRFERERERAFDYVETVRDEAAGSEELENVWTVRDSDRIADRLRTLLLDADQRLVFATHRPALLTDELLATLERRAADGLTVIAVTDDDSVRERLVSLEGVTVRPLPSAHVGTDRSGRMVAADDDTILLSVVDEAGAETAIWSSDSSFASVLVQLITSRLYDESDGLPRGGS